MVKQYQLITIINKWNANGKQSEIFSLDLKKRQDYGVPSVTLSLSALPRL